MLKLHIVAVTLALTIGLVHLAPTAGSSTDQAVLQTTTPWEVDDRCTLCNKACPKDHVFAEGKCRKLRSKLDDSKTNVTISANCMTHRRSRFSARTSGCNHGCTNNFQLVKFQNHFQAGMGPVS
ncbi:hypothetical protein pipiens_003680 [Culex pipiens pipiens]|uniref:Uncharacterized protein n=1 Tax=Culex pipiens pipiens TaxID=38569 RepID=A0ABD1CV83_CULPP